MSPIPKYVRTKKALAEYVDCSERKLHDHFNREGNPGATSSGRYNVEKWIEFVKGVHDARIQQVKAGQAATGAANEAIIQQRIRNLELKNEQEAQKLAEIRGQTITIEEHHDELSELAGIVNAVFTQLKNEVDVRLQDSEMSRRTDEIISQSLSRIREKVQESAAKVEKAQKKSAAK